MAHSTSKKGDRLDQNLVLVPWSQIYHLHWTRNLVDLELVDISLTGLYRNQNWIFSFLTSWMEYLVSVNYLMIHLQIQAGTRAE